MNYIDFRHVAITGVVVIAPLAVTGIITAVGFGAGGVAAGSFAAGIQSSLGSVSAGSLFATLQSVGVVGLSAGVESMISVIGGSAAGIGLGILEDNAYTGNIMQNVFFWDTAEALNKNMKEFEQMEIKLCKDGGYRIQSRWDKMFLHVLDDGKCVFRKEDNSLNQIFYIITDDEGVTRIRSILNKCWMYCDAVDGKIWCLNDEPDEGCEWELKFLEMNDMFDSASLQRIALIGAGVVGCTVAALLVLMGGLAAVGFESGGVVAGSIAAGIQSSIGSVAASSIFATCQSFGAAGLTASATAATSAVGAGVGLGVGVGVNEGVKAMNGTGNNDQ
ncbi:hypothetical protein HDV01_003871 [Terramyces sp. JEL0728]|nr:hypothetical protein HDV01_003871 [Terramyces sp. JEL0728]